MQREKIFVVKVGGNVIDDESALKNFLHSFAAIPYKKILVHGGGKIATSIGEKLGITSNYINGRRKTDDDTIDLVTMVYGGLINKKIVAALQNLQCNAIGVCGADGNLIPATKRPVVTDDFGWVGDIDSSKIPTTSWNLLLENDFIPVVASLTHDQQGHILNTNADTIAASVAIALSKVSDTRLIYCFEKDGILKDVEDERSVLSSLTFNEYQQLKSEGKLFAGILPKLENAFQTLQSGVSEIVIGNSSRLIDLVAGQSGTKILNG